MEPARKLSLGQIADRLAHAEKPVPDRHDDGPAGLDDDNVLRLPQAPLSRSKEPGAAYEEHIEAPSLSRVLDEAVAAIRRAESRAEALLRGACDKLKAAEARIEAAEARAYEAEAHARQLEDRMTGELKAAQARAHDAEERLARFYEFVKEQIGAGGSSSRGTSFAQRGRGLRG